MPVVNKKKSLWMGKTCKPHEGFPIGDGGPIDLTDIIEHIRKNPMGKLFEKYNRTRIKDASN